MATKENIVKIDTAETNARILHFLQTAQYAEAEKLSAWLLSNDVENAFEPNFYCGVALQFQGKVDQALAVFRNASQIEPHNLNVQQAIASCLDQLKRYEEAYQQLLKVLHLAPQDALVNANLGAISEKLGKGREALSYYDTALSLDPKNYISLMNRGALLGNLGDKTEALIHCRSAYNIHPESIGSLFNLVDALLGVYRYDEALAYSEIGLSSQPDHANLLFKKGLVLSCLKQFNEAHFCLASAQVLDPKVLENLLPGIAKLDPNVEINLNPVTLYFDAMYQGQTKCFWRYRAEFVEQLEQTISNPGSRMQLVSNPEFGFQALSLAIDGNTRLKLCQNIAELVSDLTWLQGVPPFKHKKRERKLIKIGYYSSDFRVHPTGLLARQVFGLHDKNVFEVYAYSIFNHEAKDHVRLSAEAGCNHFRDVANLSDRQIAELIYADEIDILVDLNGYTALARTGVMAMRPAPIQVLYLAYLQSMGSEFIDYAILDSVVCPLEHENHWQEKVAKLPNSLYVYDTDTSHSPIYKTRQDFGLPENGFVFCCLNNCYKIEPEIFTVWMNILRAVPDSVLWLLTDNEFIIDNLQKEAYVRGVEKERLVFASPLPHAEHLLRYQLADLFIDTFWYGAHTTALDALWQGLPVLCCMGEVPTARVAPSFLKALDMPELITDNFEQYHAKAVFYAENKDALKALKVKLKEKIKTCPLFDTPQTVKYIEAAYQHMWQRYQDGLPPETFDVPDLSQTIN
ncbi:MAG TPA: tetratricopeptide repeat protein [Methylotenera sp.]|nr:tetratricopeptide repeat protein [Methylotenera sp.]